MNVTFIDVQNRKGQKEKPMKSLLLLSFLAVLALTSCVVASGPPGYGDVVVAPPLPTTVILGADPYYYQNGYYYYYHNDNWSYGRSKSGPWTTLPRSHWPKEVRHGDRDHDQDRYHDNDRGRGSDHGGDDYHGYHR
jgi:hypothetical protein